MRLRPLLACLKCLISTAALALLITGSIKVSYGAQQPSITMEDPGPALSRMMIPGTQDLQLIVELTEPTVLQRMLATSSGQIDMARPSRERNRRMNFSSPEATGYRRQIERTQDLLAKRILDLEGAQVLGTTDTVMNTIIVRVPASQYGAVRHLPGVKKVYFSRPMRMLLDKAAAIQNAQSLWDRVGGPSKAGQGIKIAIIDSGIDIGNPMFSGTGLSMPSGFPKYNAPADQAYTNNKVIVARSYVPFLYYVQSIQTAVDEVGHGTFLSGCAAGEKVDAPLASISGMAPGAYLGSYKIFGTPGVNDSTTVAAAVKAINDAVADGMDVINLSLGGLDYLPPEEDAAYSALSNAVEAGVILAIAAGNSGPGTHTIASPGGLPEAITVGSVTSTREFLPTLRANSSSLRPMGYVSSGDGPEIIANRPNTKIVDVASLDSNGLGCSAFPANRLANSVALIKRGTCNFVVKVVNAATAGAVAVVVYNNVKNGLVEMGGLDSTGIPAVMISMSDGVNLQQYISGNPADAQVSIDKSTAFQWVDVTPRVISSFSGVGPGTDFSIKPDLVAVGENVYSATQKTYSASPMYDSSGFTVSQGTSFSTPMVAGAAAALLEHFPQLGAPAIKSLLTTTATRDITVDGINLTNVLQSGSGLLNMGNALAATAVFSPSSMNFGVHSYTGTLSLSSSLTIENISSISDEFTLELAPIVSGPSIAFSKTSTGTLAPGSSVSIEISLQVDEPNTGGFQGFIAVRSSSTGFVYRIPYWAGLYVPNSKRILPVLQNATGNGSYVDLESAIAAAQPGNIIEIQDNGSYITGPSGLVISTNGEGLPLHGLTIRAAAGKTPKIAPSSYTVGFLVTGVQNVLFQGLQFEGGYGAIELYQSSPSTPLSVTIDQCVIRLNTGGTYATGVWIDGGGTVDITRSTIEYSSGIGVVSGASGPGTQLTIVGTTIRGSIYSGMIAYDTNVSISNSTFTSNLGPGIYLQNCTGTVDGNTISQSATLLRPGAGIIIINGTLKLRNNLLDQNGDAGIVVMKSTSTIGQAPRVQLTGNRIRRSGKYGILGQVAGFLTVDGNLIADNAGGNSLNGITDALYTNNIIVRSTGSTGDGINISGGTKLRLINNTIYQNALRGVMLTNGSVTVANSIISGNKGGNLSGVLSTDIQSCLTTDTDPGFMNATGDDFSLAPASAAINAGSNSVSDLPFIDYYGRLRLASSSGLSGQGTVDIGAVEMNSAYPLVYPLAVNGNESTFGRAFTTGIAFTNPTASPATLDFTAYSSSGGLLSGAKTNPVRVSLDPQSQLARLEYELFGFNDPEASTLGSVLGSSQTRVAGFMLLCDPGFSQFSTGANASTRPGTDLVFMRHVWDSKGQASYIISNPGVNNANITATLRGTQGETVDQKTMPVAAKGSAIVRLDAKTLSSGYVRILSDRPVSGVELVSKEFSVAALGGFPPDSQTRLFFPHFAVGGGYSTQVGIVNTGIYSADLRLSAYDDNGNFLGRINRIDVDALRPGGQLLNTITELFDIPEAGPTRTGYLVAESNQAGLMGFTDFSFNDQVHFSDATIPADSVPSQRLIFSHIAHGGAGTSVPYRTGIALLNPFGTDVGYTISIYDGAGTLVATANKTIGAHKKVAKMLTFTDEDGGFIVKDVVLGNGHVEVTTNYGLIGLELFFTDDLSQMASVPAQISD
jgi:minor extracellular serine protease Vpr